MATRRVSVIRYAVSCPKSKRNNHTETDKPEAPLYIDEEQTTVYEGGSTRQQPACNAALALSPRGLGLRGSLPPGRSQAAKVPPVMNSESSQKWSGALRQAPRKGTTWGWRTLLDRVGCATIDTRACFAPVRGAP